MIMKSKTKISYCYCEVFVIGSGSAGLRAAIEAKDHGAHIIVIGRSKIKDPHTILAELHLLISSLGFTCSHEET
jgi:succinate dehydrogenase/fumarate reductase flavoprotein subunit